MQRHYVQKDASHIIDVCSIITEIYIVIMIVFHQMAIKCPEKRVPFTNWPEDAPWASCDTSVKNGMGAGIQCSSGWQGAAWSGNGASLSFVLCSASHLHVYSRAVPLSVRPLRPPVLAL